MKAEQYLPSVLNFRSPPQIRPGHYRADSFPPQRQLFVEAVNPLSMGFTQIGDLPAKSFAEYVLVRSAAIAPSPIG